MLEITGTLVAIAAFIWELKSTKSEHGFVAWLLLATILVLIGIYTLVSHIQEKIRQLNNNTNRIENLEKDINIHKQLQYIYFKLGKQERYYDKRN